MIITIYIEEQNNKKRYKVSKIFHRLINEVLNFVKGVKMKKIILLIMCLVLCCLSVNAKTIVNYKNKNNTSPIKKYKLKYISSNYDPFSISYTNKISFSIKGRIVDSNGNPISNKIIQVYYVSDSFYEGGKGLYKNTIKHKFQITTDSDGNFLYAFNDIHYIGSRNKNVIYNDLRNDGEIHFVFEPYWDEEYNGGFFETNKNGIRTLDEQRLHVSNTYKYKLMKGQNLHSISNPVRIIYKYPFDYFIKIIPYDKNDNVQLVEREESKSNVIVLDTIDLSAEYFKEKQNIIDEATKILRQEEIYNDVNKLIIKEDGSIRDNWKEIINSKIKEVKEERRQKEIEEQEEKRKKQQEIKRWKNDPELHVVQQQQETCPNCYRRYSLRISLLMKTGDSYHSYLVMQCSKCGYFKDQLNGF